jgi:AbrB family looped-hinge helix DNA binding protein
MTKKAKLSSKNQIVLPKALREYAGLRPGDELLISGSGGCLMIYKKPDNYTDRLLGLGKEMWKDSDPLEYVKTLRAPWKKRLKRR